MKKSFYVSVLSGLLAALIATQGCFFQSGPRVDLPSAKFAEADRDIVKETSAVISIPVDGEYYVGKKRIALGEIGQQVGSLLGNRRPYEQIAYLKCGRMVKYGTVVEVIDSIRRAGIDYVGFVVEQGRSGSLPAMIDAAILKNLTEADLMTIYHPPLPRSRIMALPPKSEEAGTFTGAPPPPPPPVPSSRNTVAVGQSLPFGQLPKVVVEITREGAGPDQIVSVNQTQLALSELESYLGAKFGTGGAVSDTDSTPVYVRAPRDKYYEDVISVLDQLKGAGVKLIVLRIDFLDGEDPILKPRLAPVVAEAPLEIEGGIPGGLPGGVPGGLTGGIPGGVSDEPPAPPAKTATPTPIIRKSGGALAGEAIKRVNPTYPPLAKAARVAGAVIVEVTIDETGNVISSRAISGHPLLKDAAVQAARGWKFKPTMLGGQPVKVIGTLTFNFSI